MILKYAPEQYHEVAKRMTARHNTAEDDAEAQEFLIAVSACLEVQRLQEENQQLRQMAGESARALLEQMGELE